ncbi:peptidoglycan-binding domain-containing protein [Micromonospora tulbaghiae]|nr:peptidoglycan-binding domain-containing protein [Micromonospora tulbaghiae]
MAGLYPGSSAVRVFFGLGEGLPGSAWTDATRVGRQRLADLPAGCTVVVSFKDQRVDRLAFVEAWREARPDVDLVLITHHEPEQQEGGDPTPAQYRASWTRTREQVGDHPARAEGRLRLAVCWTLQWIRRGGDWRTWWPDHEAEAVDLVLGDWYPYTPSAPDPYRPTSYEEPAAALKVMVDLAAATGKDWGLAEVDHRRILRANGYAADVDPTGELCATWYRQMHTTAKELGCRVWAHFHSDMGAALGDLTKRPAEQAALRNLIEQEAIVTTVPANLLAVRQLLLTHLNVDKDRVRADDLEPAEVGIVGDPAHRGGYHCGRDRVVSGDYSVVESSRDRAGLSGYACALDVGQFEVTTPKGRYDLPHYSRWLVAQCEAGTADTRDIREVIYSPDGRTVRRWDRLGKRTSGDSSHRWHTHQSYFRDAIKAGRDQTAVIRRYLTEIGLTTTSEGTAQMFCKHGDRGENVRALQYALHNIGFPPGTIDGTYGDATAAALKKAEASIGVTSDGKTYDADSYTRIQALFVKRFSAGERGPKGDPGGLTMDQVATELAARITAGPAAT